MAGDVECDVANIQAREVFYEGPSPVAVMMLVSGLHARSTLADRRPADCGQSWTLCRCPDANMSLDQMQERFGQVPVGAFGSYLSYAHFLT